MIPVFQAASFADAELCKLQLQRAGIACVIRNEHLQGALGELPAHLFPEVCVLDEVDLEKALAQVEQMEIARKTPDGPERTCNGCGELSPSNFERCWKCRAEL